MALPLKLPLHTMSKPPKEETRRIESGEVAARSADTVVPAAAAHGAQPVSDGSRTDEAADGPRSDAIACQVKSAIINLRLRVVSFVRLQLAGQVKSNG